MRDESYSPVRHEGRKHDGGSGRLDSGGTDYHQTHADWICDQCDAVNFARRVHCFGCGVDRPRNARTMLTNNHRPGRGAENVKPVLIVKGLTEETHEGMLLDAFQPCGRVREIRLVRDRFTKLSRLFAFVEFEAIDGAHAALDAPPRIDGVVPRVMFADHVKETHGGGSSGGVGGGGYSGGGNGALEAAMSHIEHQGPKRSAYDIPTGFVPDAASGYYYSQESGYYYDASTKLYYHPATTLWYETDAVTGLLKEYVSEAQQAAIDAANAARIAAETAAADAARAAALAAKQAVVAQKATAVETTAFGDGHAKVVLGLGRKGVGKKGIGKLAKPVVGVFKQAVIEEESEVEAADKARKEKLAAEEAAMLDWEGLICGFCRRRFKDTETLRRHADESELHKTSLYEWRAAKEKEAEQPAGSATASGAMRHWVERKGAPVLRGTDADEVYDHELDDRFGNHQRGDHQRGDHRRGDHRRGDDRRGDDRHSGEREGRSTGFSGGFADRCGGVGEERRGERRERRPLIEDDGPVRSDPRGGGSPSRGGPPPTARLD